MIKTILDTVIEKSVIPSFSSIGSRVRPRLFDWTRLESYSLKDRVVVLTGGTSGIGRAAANLYAGLGATLVLVARNQTKTDNTIDAIKQDYGSAVIHRVIGDLASRQDVERIATELADRFPAIDVLAHNAGALFNNRQRAASGNDMAVELMVATPFLLTGLLLPQLSANVNRAHAGPGRVLTMSSGGMYTEALSVETLDMPDENYHGARQYARAKRAQVVLNELWASKVDPGKTVFHALHPGWVETPGITEALPGFSRILKPLGLLRSAREGADTLLWLSAEKQVGESTGLFWHDRAIRPIDMSSRTRNADTQEQRQALWQWCEDETGWSYAKIPTAGSDRP